MSIEVSQLKISFGEFSIQIPHWSLPEKSHLLLEGPSGSGKTTFLHLLAGLIPFEKGNIQIGQHKIKELTQHDLIQFRREHCGIIFQKIHLLPHLTLSENILLGCQVPSQKSELKKFVAALGLEQRLTHLPSALSLGETQRAAVARALISEPDLILADEPTSGLDDANAEKVVKLLKSCSQGKTLIVVSHDARVKQYFDSKIDFRGLLQ